MQHKKDIAIVRELARKVSEISRSDYQNELRDVWRKHNSLVITRPLVIVWRFDYWNEIFPETMLRCEDHFFRMIEKMLNQNIFQDSLKDDSIIEPWLTIPAIHATPVGYFRWGPEIEFISSSEKGGAWKIDPPLKNPEDISKLVKPRHMIDEEATKVHFEKAGDAIGDILDIAVNREPVMYSNASSITCDLALLRGLENVYWDMINNPEWLHQLTTFMRDSILATIEKAEEKGDWRLCSQYNQAMPYSLELPDPSASPVNVKTKQLWCHFNSQEFTCISPEMTDEFSFSYQKTLMKHFGLVTYGCCEDLTRKIEYLKDIPNVRRIAVTSWADLGRCAEQIGRDYILSWRPSPTDAICNGFDPSVVKRIIREGLETIRGCHVDITLKDILTIHKEARRS